MTTAMTLYERYIDGDKSVTADAVVGRFLEEIREAEESIHIARFVIEIAQGHIAGVQALRAQRESSKNK